MDDDTGPVEIEIALIRTDGTQSRAGELSAKSIKTYAARYRTGLPMDPGVVMYDGTDYWAADIHHRLAARIAAGMTTITAYVMPGGRDEAREYGGRVNGKRELAARWTNADKKHHFSWLRQQPGWASKTSVELAEACGATASGVEIWRKEHDDGSTPRVRRDGKPLPAKPTATKSRPEPTLDYMPLVLAMQDAADALRNVMDALMAHKTVAKELARIESTLEGAGLTVAVTVVEHPPDGLALAKAGVLNLRPR